MTSSAVVVDCQMNQHRELFARKTTADTLHFSRSTGTEMAYYVLMCR